VSPRSPAAAACLAALCLAACGSDAPPSPVAARPFDDPGFVAAGGYELRYGAVQASALPAEVAAGYGIAPRSDRLVVNLSVLQRRDGGLPVAVEAGITGTWRGLAGEPSALRFRAVQAGGSVSYVAEVPLRNRDPIVLELVAAPPAAPAPLRARLTRQFDVE